MTCRSARAGRRSGTRGGVPQGGERMAPRGRTTTSLVIGTICRARLPAPPAAPRPGASAAPAPLGRLIDVQGHRIHILCAGKGSPAVILEAGTGAFSFDWSLV